MRWSGVIGFADTCEVAPSVYVEHITERRYYGDVVEFGRQMQGSDKINEDVTLSNQLSVLGDPFAQSNLYAMRYATFGGRKWKVESVKVQYPRLILTLGGVWNE